MATAKHILLLGNPVIQDKLATTEALYPGNVVIQISATHLKKNTANAADVPLTLALENSAMGKEITDAYSSGDQVAVATFYPGCHAYPLIASGQNIAVNQYLEYDNAGRLVAHSAGKRVARALEAVNATAGDTHIRVEAM